MGKKDGWTGVRGKEGRDPSLKETWEEERKKEEKISMETSTSKEKNRWN